MFLRWITCLAIVCTGLCIILDDCPENIKSNAFNLKVFKDSCFHFEFSDKKDFEDAQEACRKHGGHLAMPKDAETSNFLFDQLARVFRYEDRVYIGLSDKEDEGDYVWDDGSDLDNAIYTNWDEDKGPDGNRFRRKLKDCVTIDPDEDGKWSDERCGKDRLYVCEYKVVRYVLTKA